MSQGNVETEIKLPIASPEDANRRIGALAFRLKTPRAFESNVLYDTAGGALRGSGCLLRLRESGGSAILTYKGRGQAGKYKVREELETPLGWQWKERYTGVNAPRPPMGNGTPPPPSDDKANVMKKPPPKRPPPPL